VILSLLALYRFLLAHIIFFFILNFFLVNIYHFLHSRELFLPECYIQSVLHNRFKFAEVEVCCFEFFDIVVKNVKQCCCLRIFYYNLFQMLDVGIVAFVYNLGKPDNYLSSILLKKTLTKQVIKNAIK